jgi:hypothetical protein
MIEARIEIRIIGKLSEKTTLRKLFNSEFSLEESNNIFW